MAYTDQTKIETKLGQGLPSGITPADLDVYIAEVTQYIDTYTETTFEASGSSTKIYSTTPGITYIDIDPATSITAVEYLSNRSTSGDTWTAYETTQYRVLPENRTPKTSIYLYTVFPQYIEGGVANIRVTGIWGYSTTVPTDIQMVATNMVIDLLQDRGDIDKNIKVEKLGDISYTYESTSFSDKRDMYNKILNRYRTTDSVLL